MVTVLQSLYRILFSVHGYKTFVAIREIDTRHVLIQLLKFDHDFVNYWTLEVLSLLCRCPLNPRKVQLEFVNKHTLLSDTMLTSLIDLMSERVTEDVEEVVEEELGGDEGDGNGTGGSDKVVVEETDDIPVKSVAAPSLSSYIPGATSSTSTLSKEEKQKKLFTRQQQDDSENGDGKKTFFPNSLVIIAAASLLESLLSSLRDSSSPELMNKILDMLVERYDVLVHMLRSN